MARLSDASLDSAAPLLEGKKICIIHGFDSHPRKNWFAWLAGKLREEGAIVDIPALPTPSAPKVDEWILAIQEAMRGLGSIDEESYFVAHSLGCIATLRALESMRAQDTSTRIGGILCVAGFYEPLPILPEIDDFTKAPLQAEQIIATARKRAVLAADDDEIVPVKWSENLARAIDAELTKVAKGGHFMDSDGFTKLPIALEILHSLVKKK
ncbi:hypothetical protein BKN38_00045 [Helicobacter sp. CLO-3]|uniref:RBBP9/YdeN family alpha/beta hydrolase n=1 Tax=unclassified Helicobacter TaxID=2593540 RepID=UPI0008047B14|nr:MULTISPECIES: alpha/beta hydrolase [unclassified Helicobacter]OBV28767.1 hypothetical protein BA723_01445 [Helicobacter sp. CLO-3]OHU85837.1 hypothetical protein BKN38_00045 [Helicobacter sp. CLO-3]